MGAKEEPSLIPRFLAWAAGRWWCHIERMAQGALEYLKGVKRVDPKHMLFLFPCP